MEHVVEDEIYIDGELFLNNMKRIFRFLKALWRYILYGNRVSFNTFSKRINLCSSCENLDRDKWKCNICGCYVVKKTQMDTEECPIKEW